MKPREATVQDVDAVADLVTAMLREMASYGGHALGEETQVKSLLRTRFTASLEKDSHVYLLAPVEGTEEELAGIVEASVISPYAVFQPKSLLHVHSLYVRPRYRGEGIGRRLLDEALRWARERGCVEAELNVLASNPVRELYESMGFETTELEMRLEL